MNARFRASLPQVPGTVTAAAIAAFGTLALWLASDRAPGNLFLAFLAMGGAALVVYWSTRRPVAAFGILIVLASLSRWTIETRVGNMRLEQPAIALGLVALLYAWRLPDRDTLRRLLPITVAFAAYLAALTVSSVVFAVDRTDSLRMVFWTGLSMAGGFLAFLLLSNAKPRSANRWLQLTGGGHAALGTLVAVVFFTLGPIVFPGPEPVPGMGNKVFELSWEPNLYSSLLGALSPFAIEEFRARPRPFSGAVMVLVLVGLAFGLTRGAYLGLAAGLLAYGGVLFIRKLERKRLLLPAALAVAAIVGGAWIGPIMLDWRRPMNQPIDLTVAGWGRGYALGSMLLPAVPGIASLSVSELGDGGGSQGTGSTNTNPPDQIVLQPITDTVEFRLDRIPTALEDLVRDPLLGLGANTFGQRHIDVSQGPNSPDHIAILAVAALYESGIVGSVGLAVGFLLILFALWRASRSPSTTAMAAAYLGSLISLLVAYQATNALNFALIWFLAGAGLATAFGSHARQENQPVLQQPR